MKAIRALWPRARRQTLLVGHTDRQLGCCNVQRAARARRTLHRKLSAKAIFCLWTPRDRVWTAAPPI